MKSIIKICWQQKGSDFLLVLASLLVMLFSSCVNTVPGEEEPAVSNAGECCFSIVTRADDGKALAMPLWVYAFNAQGKCMDIQTTAIASAKLTFTLPAGTYRLIALAGADPTVYNLPSKDTATLTSTISPKNPKNPLTRLMFGSKDVTLGESDVSIMLTHVVAELNARLTEVPDEVTAVSLSLSPLYEAFSFDGTTYSGDKGKQTVACTRDANNNWIIGQAYLFPGCAVKDEVEVEVVFTTPTGVQTFTSALDKKPLKNNRFTFELNYVSNSSLNVTLGGEEWAGETIITGDFGPNVEGWTSTEGTGGDSGDGDDTPEYTVSALPGLGTIWKGCLVMGTANVTASGADLLLMSITELTATASTAATTATAHVVPGITASWHLPTEAEIAKMNAFIVLTGTNSINATLTAPGGTAIKIAAASYYLCAATDGAIRRFLFTSGTVSNIMDTGKSYLLRPVSTVHVGIVR